MGTIEVNSVFETYNYGKCKVLKYESATNVTIQFIDTGYKIVVKAHDLRCGRIKDKMKPSVCGIGYIGDGKFSKQDNPKLYTLWHNILLRCGSTKKCHNAYKDCRVAKRWHNFQNFCEDVINMPNCGEDGFELDKDMMKLGNKVYSPKFCSFIPNEINTFSRKGKVRIDNKFKSVIKRKGMYLATIIDDGRTVYSKPCKTPKEASLLRIDLEIGKAKRLAKKYKNYINPKVYYNLLNWGAPDVA